MEDKDDERYRWMKIGEPEASTSTKPELSRVISFIFVQVVPVARGWLWWDMNRCCKLRSWKVWQQWLPRRFDFRLRYMVRVFVLIHWLPLIRHWKPCQ